MELNIFIIFITICSISKDTIAQNPILSCNYTIINNRYACVLTAQNPNGLSWSPISGNHLVEKSDLDVLHVVKQLPCNTIIFPSTICTKFPNLVDIDIYHVELRNWMKHL